MNLMNLYQENYQDIQEFRDQYIAMRKVCDELDLHFGRCKVDTKTILKEKVMTNPTQAQLKKAIDEVEELHHGNRQKYGKLVDQMENGMRVHSPRCM